MLLDELEAMQAYGTEAYMKASMEWKALMCAAMTVRRTISILTQYDAIDHSKKKHG